MDVEGKVRALSDGQYTNPPDMPTHGGSQFFNAGLCARLELSTGQTVLITSKRDGNTSRVQMYHIGAHTHSLCQFHIKWALFAA